nr:hypothetical protein BaRGS_009920 [Batillaria attramentaria]
MPDIGCDFEDDSTCGWINTRGLFDQLDWTIHQGPMLSGSTGPSTDHTTGTLQGSYIFLDSTPPVNATDGNYALLMSPVVPATQSGVTGCFRFWYRMYGATTGQLSVYLLDAGQMGGHKVWSLSGQQGDQWLNAAVPLYYTQAFMVSE